MIASHELHGSARTSEQIAITHAERATLGRWTGALLLAQFAIFVVTLLTLGSAINWPASLGEPASVVLPLIAAERAAVSVGYVAYLASALLLIPIALLLRRALAGSSAQLLTIAAAFGALAGVLKILGIVRWLTVMPVLAQSYIDPAASAATREMVALVYQSFNAYAGGVGENLGVMLFSGLWTTLVALVLLRARPRRPWLGWSGLLAGAVVLAGFVEVFGVDLGGLYLTLSGVVWQLWMIALGIGMIQRSGVRDQGAGAAA